MRILNEKCNLERFFEKVRGGSLLMLDYDGTLAPFVKDRMAAVPYEGITERLVSLTSAGMARVVIVSGRSLVDLEKFIYVPNLELWGSHGFERKLNNGERKNFPLNKDFAEALQKGIQRCLEYGDRNSCEIKPYSVAFHWREMEKERIPIAKAIEKEWKKICGNTNCEIHYFDGGIELRSKERNKGNVVRELLSEVSQDAAAAYLGDDITDEEAFIALGKRGLKVLIREEFRPTAADLHLVPPKELLMFLDRWRKACG